MAEEGISGLINTIHKELKVVELFKELTEDEISKSSLESIGNEDSVESNPGVIYEDLRRTLECPNCFEVPIPPNRTYQCSNGHTNCGSCKKRSNSCGLCSAEISDTRNFAIENIIRFTVFKCKNSTDGCPEILRGDLHEDHLKTCEYESIPCSECKKNKCDGQMIPFREYFVHLVSHHQVNYKTQPITIPSFEDIHPTAIPNGVTVTSFYVYHDNQVIFFRVHVRGEIMYFWVTMLADEETALKYQVRMSFENQKMKSEWTLPIQSIRKQFTEIFENGLLAVVPTSFIQQYFIKYNIENVMKS